MMRSTLGLVVLLVGAPSLAAQQQAEPRKLTVRPAALPSPALKFELLPDLGQRTAGNRALLYQRAHSPDWWPRRQEDARTDHWLEAPLTQLPLADMRYLEKLESLQEVDRAARREYCDWEMTERVKADGIRLLLPDVQSFRAFATLLALRSRLELAEGRFDRAAYTLQTGFSLARDVANAPTLINALVGIAITSMMADRVEDWMQRPDSPNLYWALATLPEPFIDLRKPLHGERLFLEATLPELKTIDHSIWTQQQQQNFLAHWESVASMVEGWGFKSVVPNVPRKLALVGSVIKTYPEARQFLQAQGRAAAEIETMPALQVVLIYLVNNFRRMQDDQAKWMSLPYWQAREGLSKLDQELRSADNRLRSLPFLELLPAVDRVYDARIRTDRRLAALRCIEAIRAYAAGHDGRLPAALSDITEVPIPVDPVSGRAFEYMVVDDRFTLRESRLADGQPVLLRTPLHYEVTLKR
jgi:hypothetical protein